MAQLYYRYSTMNAGKSIELIKVAYNYEERGKQDMTLVPATDNRYGTGLITSRIGIQREAMIPTFWNYICGKTKNDILTAFSSTSASS